MLCIRNTYIVVYAQCLKKGTHDLLPMTDGWKRKWENCVFQRAAAANRFLARANEKYDVKYEPPVNRRIASEEFLRRSFNIGIEFNYFKMISAPANETEL